MVGDLELLVNVARRFEGVVRVATNRDQAKELVNEAERQGFKKVKGFEDVTRYQKLENQKCITMTIEWKHYPVLTVEVDEIGGCDIALLIDMIKRCREVN